MSKSRVIQFGSRAESNYTARHLIDSHHALHLHPDGHLTPAKSHVSFGRLFSIRRLHPESKQDFCRELQTSLKEFSRTKNIENTAKHLGTYLKNQILSTFYIVLFRTFYAELSALNLPVAMQFQDDHIKKHLSKLETQFSAKVLKGSTQQNLSSIARAITTSKDLAELAPEPNPEDAMLIAFLNNLFTHKKLTLTENTYQSVFSAFDDLLENHAITKLLREMKDQYADLYELLASIIQKPASVEKYFAKEIALILKHAIPMHYQTLNAEVETLAAECKYDLELSENEKAALKELEEKLTQEEMAHLQKQNTDITILDDFESLTQHENAHGTFIKQSNTIFIKADTIQSSLIHEVQHSFGLDLDIDHPMKLYRFFKKCTKIRVEKHKDLHVSMNDYSTVEQCEKEAKDTPSKAGMFKRAQYILTLSNYAKIQRISEVLAHFRQFVAVYGQEESARLLPTLYAFWINDTLSELQPKALKKSSLAN